MTTACQALHQCKKYMCSYPHENVSCMLVPLSGPGQSMPQTFNYPPLFSLASPPRLASFQATFSPASASELYGIYIWIQHVVGALYPITQHVEISLRNTIDKEARTRLGGDFWWRLPQFNNANTLDFIGNINKAKSNLDRHWKTAERKRLGLPKSTNLPPTSIVPTWTHDKIIAATDFSTWEHALRDDFATAVQADNHLYLWPVSMSRSFRRFNILNSSNALARKQLLDLVHEVREYRNRLYHHDTIWLSTTPSPSMNANLAIDSIRHKINQMELLLNVIDPRLVSILTKTGVLPNARRVCSLNELDIYRYAHTEQPFTRRKKRLLQKRGLTAVASTVYTEFASHWIRPLFPPQA
jgi:hypothetical protein